jgi:hypothetical protein
MFIGREIKSFEHFLKSYCRWDFGEGEENLQSNFFQCFIEVSTAQMQMKAECDVKR